MGLLKSVGKVAHNVGRAVGKAAKDTVNEVKRHPVIYGTLAAPLLGPALGVAGGLASKIPVVGGLVDKAKDVYDTAAHSGIATKARDIRSDLVAKTPGLTGGKDGFGLDDLLKLGLAGGAAYEGYQANQRANDLQREGLEMARGAYNERAPLRAEGMARAMGAQRPDLSALTDDPRNPYRKSRIPVVGSVAGGMR